VRYYIVAGERSGDLHGSNLVKAIRKRDSQAIFQGFGGDLMQTSGVKLSVHYRDMAFMGFISLATSLFKIFKYIKFCKNDILEFKPNAIILIDYGGFNLKIAQFAHAHGLKILYYIPPKVWAWYQSRAWKLKACVDRMFVILPFEKAFFKKYDFDVDYVGNPVLDAIKEFQPTADFTSRHQLDSNKKIVALLPGSRKIELKKIVPLMAEIAELNKDVQFVVAAVKTLPSDLYLALKEKSNVKFVEEETYDLLTVANAAIVTSGTATLETGIFKVPQVVVYKTNFLEYSIANFLVQVEFISLVNLIAGKEVIREMIQTKAMSELVNAELKQLLHNSDYASVMKQEYENVYTILDTGSASENTAQLIDSYLSPSPPSDESITLS
jgi:lipid-A-disaccharide synthase